MNDILIISYFTENYAPFARRLQLSLSRLKIPYEIEPLKDRGSWGNNARFKPLFIKAKRLQYPGKHLIWCDCDNQFLKFPDLFLETEADICFYRETPEVYNSGLVCLAPNEMVDSFIDLWIKCRQEKDGRYDQWAFNRAMGELRREALSPATEKINVAARNLIFQNLPHEYGFMANAPSEYRKRYEGIDPVVVHYWGSRTMRKNEAVGEH